MEYVNPGEKVLTRLLLSCGIPDMDNPLILVEWNDRYYVGWECFYSTTICETIQEAVRTYVEEYQNMVEVVDGYEDENGELYPTYQLEENELGIFHTLEDIYDDIRLDEEQVNSIVGDEFLQREVEYPVV